MTLDRRAFLKTAGAGGVALSLPMFGQTNGVSWAQTPVAAASPGRAGAATFVTPYNKLLILIELKGANDGLNSVVPFSDPLYASLRPRIALERSTLLNLTEREALHPSLAPLMAMAPS